MINILSTEKNGYETLSNLLTPSFRYTLLSKSLIFPTVEHCYQCAKAIFHGDYDLANKIFKAKNGWAAKKLSLKIKTNDIWDKKKFVVIEAMMDACFNQHVKHKSLLLSTKEELLTHKHPYLNLGIWQEKFPEILIKLRTKYQNESI